MLEQDDMMILSDEAQEAYNAFQRRFESDDWKALVEWAKDNAAECMARQLVASKWDDVLLCRGEARAYSNIVDLETSTENQFLALVQEARAKEIAEVEGDNE